MDSSSRTLTLTERDAELLATNVRRKGGCFVSDLPLSAQAALLAEAQRLLQVPLLVITDGPRTLDEWYRDLTSLYPDVSAAYYPSWEHLPGQGVTGSPSDLVGDRLDALRRCIDEKPPALIVTCVQALMQKTITPDALRAARWTLSEGMELSLETFLTRVESSGYEWNPEVSAKGQASRRGGIVDLWPLSEAWPIRLEWFGSTLESMRTFHPADQRSVERLKNVVITPAVEQTSGQDATLLDYLPLDTCVAWCDREEIKHHAAQYEAMITEALATSSTARFKTMTAALTRRCTGGAIIIGGRRPARVVELDVRLLPVSGLPGLTSLSMPTDAVEQMRRQYVDELERAVDGGDGVRMFFGAQGTLERFVEWRGGTRDARTLFDLRVGPLSEGFHYPAGRLMVIAENDLYGKRRERRGRYDPHTRRSGPAKEQGLRVADWRDIQPGELVVHIEHGIGRYLGLYEVEVGGQRQEAMTIEYADRAKLYLPVSQAHLLSRYVGFGKQRPDLHALGGKRWMRDKVAAERAVRDLAGALLQTQAERETQAGHPYAPDTPWQYEFENAFPFEETEDQWRAIREVKSDMERKQPMDRLVCGDVGYGKTEVAMRAAFKAVMDGRQVAVLVPTTVLAQQHFETFSERMAAFPIRVDMLSRFRTPAQQRVTVQDVSAGRVDIIIGTHRLVQPDVEFKNLGLVIIDEEQRFGVEHKEHLKHVRRLVDVLTLTATPIPRTLYMSLTGARDISTIQTPPQARLPVETVVAEYRDEIVVEAIRRELGREGQVFYLHNRVQTIELVRKKLMQLVPEARIAVGHGQMNERELESVMTAFVRGDIDVLLCTTIIESGVDIPNVNTIIIERADRFGLSDLYQLRGRVGRYKHQAYAYLLLPRHGQLLLAARHRVQAIRKYSGLGSGFKLAMRDLEIRGAGNILGAEQSGHIAAVGFDLYCQFLKRTVALMKGEAPPPMVDVEVRLDFIDRSPAQSGDSGSAVIPSSYMEDEHVRVNLYRRLASLATEEDVVALREEFEDRLGPIPPSLDRLLQIALLRILASQKGIQHIEVRDSKWMMKRDGDWIMADGRFPRVPEGTASERLAHMIRTVSTLI